MNRTRADTVIAGEKSLDHGFITGGSADSTDRATLGTSFEHRNTGFFPSWLSLTTPVDMKFVPSQRNIVAGQAVRLPVPSLTSSR